MPVPVRHLFHLALASGALLASLSCGNLPKKIPTINIPLVDIPGLEAAKPINFTSNWQNQASRTWIGPEYWANRLQDWRLHDGRLECVGQRLPYRTLHLLSHRIPVEADDLVLTVRLGLANAETGGTHEAGFLVGAGGDELDYRAASLIQSAPGPGGGLLAGINSDGYLFLREFTTQVSGGSMPLSSLSANTLENLSDLQLELRIEAQKDTELSRLILLAYGSLLDDQALSATPFTDNTVLADSSHKVLAQVMLENVPNEQLAGNLALFAHQPADKKTVDPPYFWFRDWMGEGLRLSKEKGHLFGPILSAQHTLSGNILKMTAQLPPLDESELADVHMQVHRDGRWVDLASALVVTPGWTATFRVVDWPSDTDVDYRLVFPFQGKDWTYKGTIRHDPIEQNTIVLAGFTGNHNVRHGFGRKGYPWTSDALWFPHADLVEKIEKQKPDLLFFSGDQIYEGASPTYADREQPLLDYSYKWYLWCWAYRDLLRDIPCVTIPDDHDIYQGNLWGQSGRAAKRDHDGGYIMSAEFVQMVERTQTSHLPDPWSAVPLEQGITSYYTDLVYGRISFAILEDRKFKSGPNGLVKHDGPRPDHVTDPEVDPQSLDLPEAVLLGNSQLRFLHQWAADWQGVDMKAALSQTIFAGMATHHGAKLDRILMDMDSNGWPQSGRNRALDELRRGFALMIGGDQHLATVVHHGIEQWDDAGFSFCVPSIANFYPRAWRPEGEPEIPLSDADPLPFTGSYLDGFGNKVTVYAHTNPGSDSGHQPAALHDKMPGYGIVKFHKNDRRMTLECWSRWADPNNDSPYPGWPFRIRQMDNYGRKAEAYLPTLRVSGMRDPVVQIIDEFTDEVVYTLRIQGQTFQPHVFSEGKYTVRIGELGTDRVQELFGVRGTPENDKFLFVDL
jgi:PhoD-like phosphatase